MPGPCLSCGDPCAPFGYRRRGFLSALPERHRTYVWVCGAAACKDRAEAWKRKADGDDRISWRTPDSSPPKPEPKSNQGSLF